MLVPVTLAELTESKEDKSRHLLILREKDGNRRIILQFSEQMSFYIRLAHKQSDEPPPMIPGLHAGMLNLLAEADILIHHLVVLGFIGEKCETVVHFQHGNRNIAMPMMPVDAIALAALTRCPILAEDSLLLNVVLVRPRDMNKADRDSPISEETAEEEAWNKPKDDLPQA